MLVLYIWIKFLQWTVWNTQSLDLQCFALCGLVISCKCFEKNVPLSSSGFWENLRTHYPENEGVKFFRKVGKQVPNNRAQQHGRPPSSVRKHVVTNKNLSELCHFLWVMRQVSRMTSAASFAVIFLCLASYTSDLKSGNDDGRVAQMKGRDFK